MHPPFIKIYKAPKTPPTIITIAGDIFVNAIKINEEENSDSNPIFNRLFPHLIVLVIRTTTATLIPPKFLYNGIVLKMFKTLQCRDDY